MHDLVRVALLPLWTVGTEITMGDTLTMFNKLNSI